MERQSKELLEYLAQTVPTAIEERRRRTLQLVGQLSGTGIATPADLRSDLEALARPPGDERWSTTIGRLARVEEALKKAQTDHVATVRERALRVARWAGLSESRQAEFEQALDRAAEPAREGRPAETLEQIGRLLTEHLPEAADRRRRLREDGAALVVQAKEFGAPVSALEAALAAGAESPVDAWPDTVPATEKAFTEVGEGLRSRAVQALEALRAPIEATKEYGADPSEARAALEEALARLAQASPLDVVPIFDAAREVAEEPVVTVIAGILDEVRPRIVEARRLGRDPSEVFASMNRAREALRLKIYSEAFAASQEALDRVSRLTEDLETARSELQALDEMLGRFRQVGFSTDAFESALTRVRTHLERAEVAPARELLRETVVRVGREALQFFQSRWTTLERLREYAQSRGFLPPEAADGIARAREMLDAGELASAAERIAASEAALRAAAGPFVGRRVHEMEQGLNDIPDEALTSPVRRLLADADVSLRVKQDLLGALESLRKAERDFSAVFAAHASSLVEVLEAEGRVLESMGGTTDEIQRQIDEVQQIFNMGDFVKASRASQEIRTRAQQQQLLRSEEAVSHAKLSLVELETMGVDLTTFRSQLEEAQSAARAARYREAYQIASRLEESTGHARAAAQQILDGIGQAGDFLNRLREAGIDPNPFYEPLRNARLAFQSLEFDKARSLLESVQQRLGGEEARLETARLLNEVELLVEDGRRLSTPMEPFAARLGQLNTERATAPPEATRTAARLLHEELTALIRPVLEENLRQLERDLDVARAAGVDLEKIVAPLSEARRRVALPVPVGAASLLDAARSEFVSTRGFVEHAERIAKRAREALAQAELLHANIVSLRGSVDRLDQLLNEKQYARAIELGGSLERELLQATYQHVSKMLAGFQGVVTRIRQAGVDTSLAENLLHQARMALDEGRPVEALRFAARSEAELERAELQRRIAEGSLEAASGSVAHAVAEGVLAPIATEQLDAARSSFQQRAYPDVLERAMTVLDALELAREGHRRATDALSAADRQQLEAVQNGADTGESASRLADARRFAQLGQYAEAIRAAREATEMGRWAIERLLTPPVGELRRQVATAQRLGLANEIAPLEVIVADGEAALRGREWARVRETIPRGEATSRRIFEAIADGRAREVETEYGRLAPASPAELALREQVRQQLATLRERRDFGAALELLQGESELNRRRRKEELEVRMSAFKDRIWVGERLGVDTTPIMQTFSEARVAADAGRLEDAESILARATAALDPAVRTPFAAKFKELQTEVNFAAEGLHVNVVPVLQQVREIEELERAGRSLDAARQLLKADEDLSLRKSLHRELMNLHYLIDAALARAHDQHRDTTEARALLSESLRLRETDYAAALEKAREALRRLQGEGTQVTEAASVAAPIWPFRRPPSEP